MEIKQFKLSRGATVNLGNYESARVDLEIVFTPKAESEIADHDSWLKTWLETRVREIQEAAGLPPHPVERFTGGEG